MKILIIISIIIVLLIVKSMYSHRKRVKLFERDFPVLKKLIANGKHSEALEMLEKTPVFISRYKLEPTQKIELIELEIDCLEKVNKIPEAVTQLANHLSAVFEIGEWPKDLLTKWISLYKSCDPINIEKFYFCQTCGLHPETEELLRYAIDKEGCNPPVGFPGDKRPGVVIEFSGKKFKKKKNKDI